MSLYGVNWNGYEHAKSKNNVFICIIPPISETIQSKGIYANKSLYLSRMIKVHLSRYTTMRVESYSVRLFFFLKLYFLSWS